MKYEFLDELNLTQEELARALGITRVRINEIINGKRKITPDTAYRLARYFNTTPEFWLNLQMMVDLWEAEKTHSREYQKITPGI